MAYQNFQVSFFFSFFFLLLHSLSLLKRKKNMQVKSVGINRIICSPFVLSCACSSVHPWGWGWASAAPSDLNSELVATS